MDWVYLSVTGFLLGSLFYAAFYTTSYEPEAKAAYATIGLGVLVVVVVNTWLDFAHARSDWWRSAILVGYALVTAGLVLLVRERRARARREGPGGPRARS